MGTHRCRHCRAVVRRGVLCSRCGMRQPRQVLRALLAAVGAAAVAFAFTAAFKSLEGGAPEFKPQPSDGKWPSEAEFLPYEYDGDDSMFSADISTPTKAGT